MRAEALTLLRDVVAPAYAQLLDVMRKEYLPKARTTLGASDDAGRARRTTRR